MPPFIVGEAVGPVEKAQQLDSAGERYGVMDAVLHGIKGGPLEEQRVNSGDVVLGVEDVGKGDVLPPTVAAYRIATPQGIKGDGGKGDGGQFDVHHARLHVVALTGRGGQVEVGT